MELETWTAYLGLIAFFTVVFGVLFAVSYSVILGIRDNYHRYAQKSDLQWTGPGQRSKVPPMRLSWLLAAALAGAWLVVHFIIRPGG
ncbi:MAG: hypothetical protein ACRD1R_08685 [Acidobacteriota bacterium]